MLDCSRCGGSRAAYFVVARRRARGGAGGPDEACLLTPPQHGARDPGLDCSLRSRRIALASRLLRRRSQTMKRVCSLLLSTAARDPGLDCSLRSRRIALASRLLRRRSQTMKRVCSPPQHGGARSGVGLPLRSRRIAPPQHGGARSGGWIAFFGDCAQITSRRRKISKEPRTMSVRRIDQ